MLGTGILPGGKKMLLKTFSRALVIFMKLHLNEIKKSHTQLTEKEFILMFFTRFRTKFTILKGFLELIFFGPPVSILGSPDLNE